MEREPVALQCVKDMQPAGRGWLEHVLGQHLRDNQQVLIMVFTPGVEPTEAARARARAGLEQTWSRVEKHMQEHGISEAEFDEAVDEAAREVRRRQP